MSWERRKNKWYYTRSRRVNGRVVRTYFGCGPEAEQAAAEDVQRREQLKQSRLERAVRRAKRAELEAMIDDFDAKVDMILRIEMICRGYRFHRGEWRKIRNFERKQAEWKAAKEREQQAQASAAEPPTAANDPTAAKSPRPRRPMPTRPPRTSGPGMIRQPLRGPEMTRLGKRIAAEQSRPLNNDTQRPGGQSIAKGIPYEFEILAPGLIIRPRRPSDTNHAQQGEAARPPPDRHAC